jgi:hypothetical protein
MLISKINVVKLFPVKPRVTDRSFWQKPAVANKVVSKNKVKGTQRFMKKSTIGFIVATRRPFANREQLFLSDVERITPRIIVGTLLVVLGTIAIALGKSVMFKAGSGRFAFCQIVHQFGHRREFF